MEKLDEILQAVLKGQEEPEILLPEVDEQTGDSDISGLVEQLKDHGISEEEVDDNAENILDYIEVHRDEVLSHAIEFSLRVRGIVLPHLCRILTDP